MAGRRLGRELVQRAFHLLVLRPFLKWVVGMRVRGAENLPAQDPFLLVANHNSHLDTALLLSLFPLSRLRRIHPVAAADYWYASRGRRLLAETLFGILPVTRGGRVPPGEPGGGPRDVHASMGALEETLAGGESLILFPEGTRGEPEVMGRFHSGAARIALAHPGVPVVPVYLRNAGRALPRGDFLVVPFICDVVVGRPVPIAGSLEQVLAGIETAVKDLAEEVEPGTLGTPPA